MDAGPQPLDDRRPSRACDVLSDQQKACLRLVSRGMSSKEISHETGLAPQTVDTYLKQAMSRLGVSSRRQAARLLTAFEAPQKSGSPSPAIAIELPETQSKGAADGRMGIQGFLPPLGGTPNRLSTASRTYAALRVAAVASTTVIALALLMAGAFKAFH